MQSLTPCFAVIAAPGGLAVGSPKWNALKRRRNARWGPTPVDDVVIVVVGGDGAAHDQKQHLRQRVGDAPSLARVRYGAEVVQQAASVRLVGEHVHLGSIDNPTQPELNSNYVKLLN